MILNDSYCAYINLDSRPDRNQHMIKELERVGIKADRFEAYLPDQFPDPQYDVMRNRTKGAIGCHMSQREVMLLAKLCGKHALVMEDDLVFCDDFQERLVIIEEFLSKKQWDIFWFGGTYHKNPTWHSNPHPQDLKQCHCTLNRDYEKTDNEKIVRTYGAFSTHCYLVNRSSIGNVVKCLDRDVNMSMGIDWLMILNQPNLKTYAFDPGCVKQMDNMSNIGNGMTYFSGFAKLGEHWFKERM